MFFRCVLVCLVVCLAGTSPFAATAQTGEFSLVGSVTDPDGAAIAGATVLVLETSLVATTNAKGEFTFTALAAGRYTLRVTSRDFENEQVPVEVGASGRMRPEIRLRQIRAAVASVEVVGEAVEAVLETPGSLFVVGRAELRNSHPMDANEVLRRVPGVVINDNSGPVATRLNIGIRGLNPDRSRSVLVLEDGLPVTLAPYGEPETYYSPSIDRMDRVEVVKGSGRCSMDPRP